MCFRFFVILFIFLSHWIAFVKIKVSEYESKQRERVLTCWYYKYKTLLFVKHLAVTSVCDFILELILKGNFCINFHFQFIEHLVNSFIQKHKHQSHNILSQNQSHVHGLPFHTVWLCNAKAWQSYDHQRPAVVVWENMKVGTTFNVIHPVILVCL